MGACASRLHSITVAHPHAISLDCSLDMYSDVLPVWNRTDGYFGHDFIWTLRHNVGARSGLYGNLNTVVNGPTYALFTNLTSGCLHGIGVAPDGIEVRMYCMASAWLCVPLIPQCFYIWHGPKACAKKRTGATASWRLERLALLGRGMRASRSDMCAASHVASCTHAHLSLWCFE